MNKDMPKLNHFTERRSFLLAQVNATETSGDVTIDIPQDALVATNKEGRKFFEADPMNKGIYRWPAGGVGLILELNDANILLAIYRDKDAPSYGGHDTLSSGLGSSVRELLYPLETAWREGAEELCITTPDSVICPIPENDHFGFGIELSEVVRGTANLFPELIEKKVVDVATTFLPLRGEREIIINYAGKQRRSRGLVVFDAGCNGIDIIKAVVVPVNCSLSELKVYDGELGSGSKPEPLNRRVNAYALDGNFRPLGGGIIASWIRGERVETETKQNPMTPVLKVFYEALNC